MASPIKPEASPFSRRAKAPTPKASRRHARRERQRRDQMAVIAIAVVVAVVGGLTRVAPTGFAAADALWCAGLAGGAAWAASRSRRWAWLWSAGIVAAGAIGSWWALLGVAALVLAMVGAFTRRRSRPMGAVIGGLVGLTGMHLHSQGFHGFPSLVAALALVPLFWSAYERSSPTVVRRINRGVLVGFGLAVLAVGAFGVSAFLARSSLNRAVNDSRAGLDQIRGGHQSDATARLDLAADEFHQAAGDLNGLWTWPARLVPVVAQQRQALARASGAGSAIARTGSVAADTAPYQQLKASNGRVDLATVRSFQAPVADALGALVSARATLAQVRSPWLVSPVASPLADFSRQVDDAIPQAQLASQALDVAPSMLGADGDRTYLILFTNPAESRFLGGFTGSFGVLTAHAGKVSFTVGDRIDELFPGPKGARLTITGQPDFLARYGRYDPARNLQDLTVSPDLPTDATVTRSLFRQYYGTELAGIVVVDPYGLAALLKLTGPVQVEGLAQPLTSANAAQYLIYQQYVTYGSEKDDRKDVLSAAGRATFKALTSRDLPGPTAVGAALGPVVQQGRLMFYPFAPDALSLFGRIGTLGQFHPTSGSDYLSVRSANANPSKIDSFLTRGINYQVTYDPANGMVSATATVTVHNAAPARGLPDYLIGNSHDPTTRGGTVPLGTNTMYLSVYTPLSLASSTVDGRASGIESQTESGANVYSTDLSVGPGGTSTLVLHLEGTIAPGPTYHLQLLNQPMVNNDNLAVSVAPSSPAWHVSSAVGLTPATAAATTTTTLSKNERLAVRFIS